MADGGYEHHAYRSLIRAWFGWTALLAFLLSQGLAARAGSQGLQTAPTNAQLEMEEGIRLFEQNEFGKAAEFLTRALAKTLGKADRSRAREFLILSYLSLERAADSLEMLFLLYTEDPDYSPIAQMPLDVKNLFDQSKASAGELSRLRKRVTDLEADKARLSLTSDAQTKELAALSETKTQVERELNNARVNLPLAQQDAYRLAMKAAQLIGRANLSALLGIRWVPVTAGRFDMGCSPGDKDCLKNEGPVASVAVAAFQLMETEVTIGMFEQFTRVPSGRRLPEKTDVRKASHPVASVPIDDARAFCEWLHARLPTEAEWEFAARAGGTTRYSWGADWEGWRVNKTGQSQPTGQLARRNRWGLIDMLGSVWEWTSSNYFDYPYKALDGREDASMKGNRVVRGGAWDSDRELVRVSSRRPGVMPDTPPGLIGFRCAVSTP